MAYVMIVDDEADLRASVGEQLESAGHSVMEAEDGRKCLDLLEEREPELILMDIRMPELDGWETIKEMRDRDLAESVPIVMLTVEELSLAKMVREELKELTGYIEKPFTKSELIDTVERVTERMGEIRAKAEKIGRRMEAERPEARESFMKNYREIRRKRLLHERLVNRLEEMKAEGRPEDELADIEDLLETEEISLKLLDLRRGVMERMARLGESE